MDITAALKERWKADKHDRQIGAVLRPHFHRALDAMMQLRERRDEIEKDKNLSDTGRAAKLRDAAKGEAKLVGKAKRTLEAARAKLAADRLALVPGVKDKTDVAAAIRRQEIRTTLSAMTIGRVMGLLNSKDTPAEVLAAVLEFPLRLESLATMDAGAYATAIDRATETIMSRDNGPAMAAIQDQSEAVELLNAAIRLATTELRTAVAMHESGFQQWFDEAAPKDATELAAEAAKVNEESATSAALALPASARHTLISSLLAANSDELVGTPKIKAA